jgi:predicted PhzF superfamily epimerase YddE/YHI9
MVSQMKYITQEPDLIMSTSLLLYQDDGDQYDFVSRYFAPWVGIPEDPVTGSAHTVLAPFWYSYSGY